MKIKVLLIALFTLNIFQVNAQNKDEVTLVVSADGATKEEATKVALRSAIEQAYGTFVSANTTILNDEMVKDEIVTISNGNIKQYKEIASVVLPNGKQSVTLQATVCISKLVSYAKSKGASTEFAGATFGINMKMLELNKQNEIKALNNLLFEIEKLLPHCFEKKLFVGNPVIKEDGNYRLPILLLFEDNEIQKNLDKMIQNTLECLSISKEKELELSSMGIRTYDYFYDMLHCIIPFYYNNPRGTNAKLRNDVEHYRHDTFGNKLMNLLRDEVMNFDIVDNNGKKYEIFPYDRKCVYIGNDGKKVFHQYFPQIEARNVWNSQEKNIGQEILKNGGNIDHLYTYRGREGFSLGYDGRLSLWYFKKSGDVHSHEKYIGGANFLIGFSIGIAKEEIMNISNFSVQRKK